MKTNNFYKICLLFITMSMSISCVQDDGFKVPEEHNEPDPAEGITANITIAEVKALFSGSNTAFVSDLIVEGYVVSSDASGNFYKELYIQDHPSNPTAAIRLALDKTDLYLTYGIGRKLFIRLEGLSIGEGDGNVLTIGQEADGEITGISAAEIPDFVIKSATVEPVIGKLMSFSEISEAHIGMYVSFSDAQIEMSQLGLPFVDAEAPFSSQRILESCEEDTMFILETSAFADFSQFIVPGDGVVISGIITRDFSGSVILLMLNDDADMISWGDRCDPGIS